MLNRKFPKLDEPAREIVYRALMAVTTNDDEHWKSGRDYVHDGADEWLKEIKQDNSKP
jgi:hypothetical protein